MDGVDIHPEAGTIEVTSTFKARNKIKGGGVVDNNASRMKVSTLQLALSHAGPAHAVQSYATSDFNLLLMPVSCPVHCGQDSPSYRHPEGRI